MADDFSRNGFEVVENKIRLDPIELEHISTLINKSKNENFGIDTVLKIISWDHSEISHNILKKITTVTSKVTAIDEETLTNNFSKDVYYTEQTKESENRNQYPHFDWIPKIKAFLYLSDNSGNNRGSIYLAKKSHKSFYMKIINFMRYFITPGYNYKSPPFFFKRFVKSLSFTEVKGNKFSLVIFDTDTIHHSGIVELDNFTRIVLRFDFYKNNKHRKRLFPVTKYIKKLFK